MGDLDPWKLLIPMGGSEPPSNTWFLGPTRVLDRHMWHLNQFSCFCRAHYCDRPTGRYATQSDFLCPGQSASSTQLNFLAVFNISNILIVNKVLQCSPKWNSTPNSNIDCSQPVFLIYWSLALQQIQLECGPMPNLMVALPNIGGALCSTPQSLADAHY